MADTPSKIRVLALAPPPPEPPAILTSLLLATVPRLRVASPLRFLPAEVLLRIAHYAHQPTYRAGFSLSPPPEGTTVCQDLHAHAAACGRMFACCHCASS